MFLYLCYLSFLNGIVYRINIYLRFKISILSCMQQIRHQYFFYVSVTYPLRKKNYDYKVPSVSFNYLFHKKTHTLGYFLKVLFLHDSLYLTIHLISAYAKSLIVMFDKLLYPILKEICRLLMLLLYHFGVVVVLAALPTAVFL